jgi:hypothetical protein
VDEVLALLTGKPAMEVNARVEKRVAELIRLRKAQARSGKSAKHRDKKV